MRYSEIVGPGFYNIGLSARGYQLVDAHFLAAAHHRARGHAAQFAAHVRALYRTISAGDFSRARDPLGDGLDHPEFWRPPPPHIGDVPRVEACLPDPGLFQGFPPDRRFGPRERHPYDALLEDPARVEALYQQLLAA